VTGVTASRLATISSLVARRSGRESERYGVLERVRGCIDGDRRRDAHECCGLLIDGGSCACAAFHRERIE
jgi:hypothetical protein